MLKRKVLLVDDEKCLVQYIKMNLELDGKYEVKGETVSMNALQTAREFQPDIILLDVLLPGMNGFEVEEQLRNDEMTKNIPVVFLTASTSSIEQQHPRNYAEGRRVLTKPISTEDLIMEIEKELKSQHGSDD